MCLSKSDMMRRALLFTWLFVGIFRGHLGVRTNCKLNSVSLAVQTNLS